MPFAARAAVYGLTSGKPEVLSSRLAQWCFGLFAFMANDERGDRSEFGPSAESMRSVRVVSLDPLAGDIDDLWMPRNVYYAEVVPVLGKIRKRLEAGK